MISWFDESSSKFNYFGTAWKIVVWFKGMVSFKHRGTKKRINGRRNSERVSLLFNIFVTTALFCFHFAP